MATWFLATLPVLLAQAGGGAAGGGGGNAGGGAPAGRGGGGGFDIWFFLPLLMIGILFYFMVMMPERRKRRELQEMLGNLKENQRVVTIGGIIGTIVHVSPDNQEVVLRTDEKSNTRVRVLRSAIARPLKAEGEVAEAAKELGK
jgi:preprotein translocase subunit YajC